MRSSDPGHKESSGKFNVQIGEGKGVVIGDQARVEQHFHYAVVGSTLTVEQLRNRTRMLAKVRAYWITGVLKHSLHGAAIDLGLCERPEAVTHPWDLALHVPDQPAQSLPQEPM